MNEPGFLLCYPCYLLGRYSAERLQADPSLHQEWAITEANHQPSLMVFAEQLLAERLMIAEAIAAIVVAVETPAALAEIIRRNRQHFTMILIDPNPTTRISRGFSVDEFLQGFGP